LASHPRVKIVGEAADIESAVELCDRLQPDLVFLDVQLRREKGFDLLPRLTHPAAIIFVTAYDRYAVRAVEVNALDYLLKPVHPERLATALARVGTGTDATRPAQALTETDVVSLREDSGLRLVPVREITHIQSEENYSRVHLAGARPALVRRSMTE